MNKLSRTLICFGCLSASAISMAQWTQYHGNAQRTGYSPVVSPSILTLSWTADIEGPIVASPVIGPDGTIYIGPVEEEAGHPRTVITAIASDGGVKWRFYTKFVDIDLPTFSTPAVGANGILYIGSTDGAFYALKQDGTVLWKYQGENPIVQSPAIGPDGTVYVGIDGALCSFSASGTLNWKVPVGSPRQSGGPAIALDGTIYESGSTDGIGSFMHAFSPSGTILWTHFLNQYFWPLAPPTVGPDGTIYTVDQGIRALNPDGSQKWYSEPSYGINGYGSLAVDPDSNIYYTGYVYVWKLNPAGTVVWRYTHTSNGSQLGSSVSGLLVDGEGKLTMGMGAGKRSAIDYEKQVIVLNASGGRQNTFPLPEIAGASSPALAENGSLYIGCLDNKLYAFNVPAGVTEPPAAMTQDIGLIDSGTVGDLAGADGHRVSVRQTTSQVSLRTQQASIIIDGTADLANPSMMKLEITASTDAPSARALVECFNWTTGKYEPVKTFAVTRVDGNYDVYPTGSVSRFIQAGTRSIRARLGFDGFPPSRTAILWHALFDRAVWRTIR